MDRFLELDKNERLPLGVTIHLLYCKKCRTEVRLFTMAEKVCAQPLKIPVADNDKIISLLMKKIDPSYDENAKVMHISMRRWIVSGVAMILAMLVFLFVRSSVPSNALDIAFCLLFTCVVSAYCALFVGSNMDFFVKKIETLKDFSLRIPGIN